MYLKEMGNVELLSREGEIAIAKKLSLDWTNDEINFGAQHQ